MNSQIVSLEEIAEDLGVKKKTLQNILSSRAKKDRNKRVSLPPMRKVNRKWYCMADEYQKWLRSHPVANDPCDSTRKRAGRPRNKPVCLEGLIS